MSNCSFPECERPTTASELCVGHYRQKRKGQVLKPLKSAQPKPDGPCAYNGCDRPPKARGYCEGHARLLRAGEPLRPLKSIAKRGSGHTSKAGYRVKYLPEHPNANRSSGQVYEHVVVMSELLGRPLEAHESVHHKNGQRADNRPENLELWSTSQPYGQLVADKVEWAIELLKQYRPEALA